MAQIKVDLNKPLAVAIAKFTKMVKDEGILQELRKKEFHLTKSQKRKLKSLNARRLQYKLDKKRNKYENKER